MFIVRAAKQTLVYIQLQRAARLCKHVYSKRALIEQNAHINCNTFVYINTFT